MNELMTSANVSANIVANPFGAVNSTLNTNVGMTQTSTRELAEMQAGIFLAKQFPRDQRQATENILTACQRPGLANVAVYSYARGGTNIAGPSIRLAEELARNWGNLDCGWNEIEREFDKSKLEAWAWDKQTNVKKMIHFFVPHYRTTRLERKRITDERDLYELLANQAARRMRNCILALIPGDIIDAAVEQCQRTMVTHVDISPDSIKKLADAFAQFGVTKAQIEKRIQRRLDAITPAQFVKMREIYTSLNDGMSDPADWFEAEEEKSERQSKKITAAPAGKATAATENLKATLLDEKPEAQPAPRTRRSNARAQTTTPPQTNEQVEKDEGEKPDYRTRIAAAQTRDDLAAIADDIIKDTQIADEERDALYRMIEDVSLKIEKNE